jgi:hypothetical protein
MTTDSKLVFDRWGPAFCGGYEWPTICPESATLLSGGSRGEFGPSPAWHDNEFVRTHCVDFASGKEHVFKLDEQTLSKYPAAPSAAWLPPKPVSKLHAFSEVTLMPGEWLDALYADLPGMENLLPEQVEFIDNTSASIRKLHATMVNHVKKQIESASGVERLSLQVGCRPAATCCSLFRRGSGS